jgi:hypothetical protein
MVIWNLKFWLWRTEVAIEQPLKYQMYRHPRLLVCKIPAWLAVECWYMAFLSDSLIRTSYTSDRYASCRCTKANVRTFLCVLFGGALVFVLCQCTSSYIEAVPLIQSEYFLLSEIYFKIIYEKNQSWISTESVATLLYVCALYIFTASQGYPFLSLVQAFGIHRQWPPLHVSWHYKNKMYIYKENILQYKSVTQVLFSWWRIVESRLTWVSVGSISLDGHGSFAF